mmetsp:Transcript_24051/g.80839  ORF Transcript_24051/g.80839 Transcript_24051/m.80839 type:complete len:224 (-) Transcript_24051:45-716(-)
MPLAPYHLVSWPRLRGVVVLRNGPPRPVVGALERIRVAVVGEVRRGEDDEAVLSGLHPLHAVLHAPVPELQVPAPRWVPAVVQVEKDVHAALQGGHRVAVEVRVDLQRAIRKNLVQAAALVVVIRAQAGNARELLEESHESRALHGGDDALESGPHGRLAHVLHLESAAILGDDAPPASLGQVAAPLGCDAWKGHVRKFLVHRVEDAVWEDVVKVRVWKRRGR